jgi:hypothetical protein
MCNLYSNLTAQTALSRFSRALRDKLGNYQPQPGIYPDYEAPIVRTSAGPARVSALHRERHGALRIGLADFSSDPFTARAPGARSP